ncbi:MAG: helix-turn-helix domain-containing protein [bacterium]
MGEKIGVKEASKILGVSRKTVYSRLRSGKIEGEKIETKHGLKWVIDRDKLKEQATREKEVVEVKEINRLIKKKELMNELIEAINSENRQVIEESMDNIDNKLDKQKEQFREQSEHIQKQRELIEKQNEYIKELSKEIKEIKTEQKKSFFSKIKDLF